MINFIKEFKTAKQAAKAGGRIALSMFGKEMKKSRKGKHRDFVTEADKLAENKIIRIIKSKFPDHSILAEEGGAKGASPYRWLIDPIDGTHNFYDGIPIFGTMVAL